MASYPVPGSKDGILRNLRHLRAPAGGSRGGKFRSNGVPTHAQTKSAYVHHYDRIPYWNIVPGDTVTLRRGRKVEREDKSWTKGEAQVASIDRMLNRVWLENKVSLVSLSAPRSALPTDTRIHSHKTGKPRTQYCHWHQAHCTSSLRTRQGSRVTLFTHHLRHRQASSLFQPVSPHTREHAFTRKLAAEEVSLASWSLRQAS